ncbi:MAG TPA: hypothetical protein VMF61_00870 [Candidatus Acidoferrales bacterium]|nr:hypothetical protein [Candidatus Acidoferrales bacterium]
MRFAAVFASLALIGASGAPATVTVTSSSIGFKQAMAACPNSLASVSFALGHVRIAEQPGVASDLDDTNPESQTLILRAADGTSGNVQIDAKSRSVKGVNVKAAEHNTVACIGPS